MITVNEDIELDVDDDDKFYGGQKFERHVTFILERSLHKGMVVMDIGANVGVHTVTMARHAGHVFAIEAIPDNYNRLVNTTKQFDNVECYNLGMWHQKARRVFNYAPSNHACSYTATTEHDIQSDNQKVYVNCETLENFVQGRPRIDLIKMDIEGAEFHVLSSSFNWLRDTKPTILMELNTKCPKVFHGISHESLLDLMYILEYKPVFCEIKDSEESDKKVGTWRGCTYNTLRKRCEEHAVTECIFVPKGVR